MRRSVLDVLKDVLDTRSTDINTFSGCLTDGSEPKSKRIKKPRVCPPPPRQRRGLLKQFRPQAAGGARRPGSRPGVS